MVAAPDGSPHVSGQYSLAAVVRLFKIAHLPLGSSGPLTASSAGVSPADISPAVWRVHHVSATLGRTKLMCVIARWVIMLSNKKIMDICNGFCLHR